MVRVENQIKIRNKAVYSVFPDHKNGDISRTLKTAVYRAVHSN